MGVILVSLEMITVEKYLRLGFPTINNKAEHEALLAKMMMVNRLEVRPYKLV